MMSLSAVKALGKEKQGVWGTKTHPHSWGLSSQATVEHLLFSPRFTAKGNELVRAKRGHLATGWGQLTTSNKSLIRNRRGDFQRSSLLLQGEDTLEKWNH